MGQHVGRTIANVLSPVTKPCNILNNHTIFSLAVLSFVDRARFRKKLQARRYDTHQIHKKSSRMADQVHRPSRLERRQHVQVLQAESIQRLLPGVFGIEHEQKNNQRLFLGWLWVGIRTKMRRHLLVFTIHRMLLY